VKTTIARVSVLAAALFAALLAAGGGRAAAEQTTSRPFVGVVCIERVETAPRPMRMHVVDIDLAAAGIRFRLTPHSGPLHTVKQTTLDFLKEQHAQIAINAHFFEPWPVPNPDPGTATLVGIAASDGEVYAPFLDQPPKAFAIHANAPGLNIDAANHAAIVHRNPADASGLTVTEPVKLYTTLAGNEQIVADGKVTAAHTDWNGTFNPRTAIGVTGKQHLILFVVDGRQPKVSEGMSVPEVAELLVKDYAVVEAISMDGGGSTTLALADPAPRLVNVPVGIKDEPGSQRPVGSSLAVFAVAVEPATATKSVPASIPSSAPAFIAPYGKWERPWATIFIGTCFTGGLGFWLWRRRSSRGPRSRRS
jgi:hypothetical protein